MRKPTIPDVLSITNDVSIIEMAMAADQLFDAAYTLYLAEPLAMLVNIERDCANHAPPRIWLSRDGGRVYVATDKSGQTENMALTETLHDIVHRQRWERELAA